MGVLGFIKRLRNSAREISTADRLNAVLLREATFDNQRDFFVAVVAAVPFGHTLSEGLSRLLVTRLRPSCDGYGEKNSQVVKDMDYLWGELSRRTGDALCKACHAEVLLARGKKQRAMQSFLAAFDKQPELVFEFGNELPELATSLGPETLFNYRLQHLRALLASDADGDDVREEYSELLDEYAEDPSAMARLHSIGSEIDEAVAAGRLPRALMRRGASRRSPERSL